MSNERIARLQAELQAASLPALAVLPGPNMKYLTGVDFHLYERPIVAIFLSEGNPIMIVPEMERAKAETAAIHFGTFSYGEDPANQIDAFVAAMQSTSLAGNTLAVEPLRMRFHELELLRRALPGLKPVPGTEILRRLRSTKDSAEAEDMRQAVHIAETALESLLPRIRAGMSEREIAAELVIELLRGGSDLDLPFQPIVASGPNSALPHATVTDREISGGDFLLIDWGARYAGYCSDLTRTFSVGEPSEEMQAIHAAVLSANQAGQDAAHVGAEAGAVDHAGRQQIEAAGYGDLFSHRIGHGLGLEAHEDPYLFPGSKTALEVGMTFTIEPGVYQRGRGGVRIEDNMLITPAGGESLSSLSRELRVIG